MNQDYKILAKLIAERIKLALPYLIDNDQSGFIKGRFIGQNITSIIDLINYTDDNDISALLISIDYEKAFDKLEWLFIQKSLSFFNFPPVIKKWVEILYTDISSCVTNNGWNSAYFPIKRGVRQGCPLSPYLFIIASEILAIHVRQNSKIKGIKIGDKEYKIKLYADDTQIFILYEKESITETALAFKDFSSISGLVVNFDKSNILRIGSIKNTNVKIDTTVNFTWTNENITILGITISSDIHNLMELNLIPIVNKMKNLAKIWRARKLSLFGKIVIINSLLVSQLIYRLTVLPTPDADTIKIIDVILYDFLWDQKPHRIAKKTISNLKKEGGLKMINVKLKDESLKISWIKRILENPRYSICPILDRYCKIEIPLLLKCNLEYKDIEYAFSKPIPLFWQNVIQSWCNYNFKPIDTTNDPTSDIIWFNSNIRIDNRVIFNKEMFTKGIIYLKDFTHSNGDIYSHEEFKMHYSVNINFLTYYSIIHAIPTRYKEALKVQNDRAGIQQSNIENIKKVDKISKYVYNTLITKNTSFPEKAFDFHNRTLNINISKDTYISSFELLYSSTSNTKLLDFQYRVLHNILITNIQLKQWHIKEDDNCTFCASYPETTSHLLLDCQYSIRIWREMFDYIATQSGARIILENAEKILGVRDKPFSCFYNTLCVIAKQYIYACRCKNIKPTISVLIEKIRMEKYVEKSIAIQNDKISQWNKKWELLSNLNFDLNE